MNMQDQRNNDDEKLAPYFYFRDHGVKNWNEFRQFNEDFPDASDALVTAIMTRLIGESRGAPFDF